MTICESIRYNSHGHFAISEIIASYLSDTDVERNHHGEQRTVKQILCQIKDYINRLFTRIDNYTNSFHSPVEVSNGLGLNKWEQIIDGRFAKIYGQFVFDEGLHRGPKEPGYLNSCLDAARFAEDNLGKRLTVSFYKELHAVACQHFDGTERSGTLIAAKDRGNFIHNQPVGATFSYANLFYDSMGLDQSNLLVFDYSNAVDTLSEVAQAESSTDSQSITAAESSEISLRTQELESSHKLIASFQELLKKKLKEFNDYIKSRSLGYQVPFARVYDATGFKKNNVLFSYRYALPKQRKKIEAIVERLFDEYNRSIFLAINSDERITAIADLFQKLEWLHPFPDGQGRADILLLTKLLCENEFCPFILDQPYFSSCSTLPAWVEYLKEGMKNWQARLYQIQTRPQTFYFNDY